MFGLIVTFVLLSAVIIVAGTFLAKFADDLATITGLGRSMAGIVLLAMATSLPELLVGCSAARIPAINLTMGDLLGSSLFNLLILSILDLLTKTRGGMLNKTAAAHALSAASAALLTGIVLLFLLFDFDGIYLRLGLGSWVILIAYSFCLRLIYYDQQFAIRQSGGAPSETEATLRASLTGYLVCTVAVFLAAPSLARVAGQLAEQTGLGQTIFGTMFVALVTSLPEAVTTLTALRIGAVDLAIGNIFGSNAFNMVILAGVDAAYDGSLLADAAPTHAITAVMVIIVTCVAMLGMLYRAEKRYWLVEPDALLVMLLVIGALCIVFTIEH